MADDANKTTEKQKVLKELTRARAGVDSFQKQSAARAERIDFLYGEIRPKAKAIAQMLPKLSSLKRLTPEKALPRLKMFRANFGLMLELLEEIRFERYKYARQLSREQKEKYWKDLPENPNPAEFKALRESAAEFDKTIAKIERRQEIDSEEWADMFARLGMRILSVFEGRPRKLP